MNTGDVTVSEEYVYLKQRLERIKQNFNVETFKNTPWVDLDDVRMDYARAYVALCHAEIESYLEYKSVVVVDKALHIWNESGNPTLPLLSLFAHFEFIEKNCSTNEKVNMITQKFKHSVVRNNGIKEENIKKLFKPLGINVDELDTAWIATLNSYGAKRGETVHVSAKIQQPLDVSALINDTERICNDAIDFDKLLNNFI